MARVRLWVDLQSLVQRQEEEEEEEQVGVGVEVVLEQPRCPAERRKLKHLQNLDTTIRSSVQLGLLALIISKETEIEAGIMAHFNLWRELSVWCVSFDSNNGIENCF